MKYIILDWAGNDVFRGKTFDSFDDGEEFLSEFLGDNYETDRQEYYVLPRYQTVGDFCEK